LLWGRRDPDVQLGVFMGDHSSDQLGVDPIGLAAQPHALGIVTGVLGIEDKDDKAKLVGHLG